MQQQREYYEIQLFPTEQCEKIHFQFYDKEGAFLSAKGRICGFRKAAQFDTAEEAESFFRNWKYSSKYGHSLLRCRVWN